jgi:hypothetical protein
MRVDDRIMVALYMWDMISRTALEYRSVVPSSVSSATRAVYPRPSPVIGSRHDS